MTTNNNVRTTQDAVEVITDLLVRFTTNTAFERMTERAQDQKQTVGEVARRTASNLLRHYDTSRVW